MRSNKSKTRPVIGITCDLELASKHYELPISYRAAVEKAGGLPVLLPATDDLDVREAYLNLIDGLVVPGGDDLDPELYHQHPHPKTRLSDPLRQRFDLALLAACENTAMPILAICMGCQSLNVQRGGDLIQFIPEHARDNPVPHTAEPGSNDRNAWHEVNMASGGKLAAICGHTRMQVNSRHRQGIGRLGRNLRLSAWAIDGIIEAVEDATMRFCVGVQWHPENLTGPAGEMLFEALITAARDHAEPPLKSMSGSR